MKRNKCTVRLLQIAENDLNDIITYIALENRKAAEAIASRIEKTCFIFLSTHILGKFQMKKNLLAQDIVL